MALGRLGSLAKLIYAAPQTSIVFKSTGGDAVFTPTSLGAAAGWISAQYDRGPGSKPGRYRWQAKTQANVNPTVGGVVRVYLVLADSATGDGPGQLGTADATVPAEARLGNAQYLGSVQADQALNTVSFIQPGLVEIYSRYVQVAWWNDLSQALHGTAGNHEFRLVAYPDELQ